MDGSCGEPVEGKLPVSHHNEGAINDPAAAYRRQIDFSPPR